MANKINEATSTDLPIIQKLVNESGWKVGDTLLYQQIYDIPEDLRKDYSTLKNIRPDIILQDLNGDVLAVIENNLDEQDNSTTSEEISEDTNYKLTDETTSDVDDDSDADSEIIEETPIPLDQKDITTVPTDTKPVEKADEETIEDGDEDTETNY